MNEDDLPGAEIREGDGRKRGGGGVPQKRLLAQVSRQRCSGNSGSGKHSEDSGIGRKEERRS